MAQFVAHLLRAMNLSLLPWTKRLQSYHELLPPDKNFTVGQENKQQQKHISQIAYLFPTQCLVSQLLHGTIGELRVVYKVILSGSTLNIQSSDFYAAN
jgi:hypothetical protein